MDSSKQKRCLEFLGYFQIFHVVKNCEKLILNSWHYWSKSDNSHRVTRFVIFIEVLLSFLKVLLWHARNGIQAVKWARSSLQGKCRYIAVMSAMVSWASNTMLTQFGNHVLSVWSQQMCLSVLILGVWMMIFLPRDSVQQEVWNKFQWLKCKFVFTEGDL